MKLLRCVLTVALLLAAAYGHGEAVKFGPSFKCAKARTAVEKEICSNAAIAQADLYLADIYKVVLDKNPDTKSALIAQQKHWQTEIRDHLCIAGDFGWTKQAANTFDERNPLLKCYQIRIAELRANVSLGEIFINKWMNLFSKANGDNLEYGGSLTQPENVPRSAQDYYNDKTMRVKAQYYGHECEGERYFLYFADDKFMRFASAKPNCEAVSPPDTFSNLCLVGTRYEPVSSYWKCHQKMTTRSVLDEMEQKISNGMLDKILRGDGRPVTDPESFVWGLTRVPALVYNDPKLYTSQSMTWAIQHKALFAPTLAKHKKPLQLIFKQLMLERKWILSHPDWKQQLASMTGSPLGNSEKIEPADYMKEWSDIGGLSNTQYSMHDFYVQVWARLYQNGGMEKAVEAIKVFNAELQTTH